MENMVTVFLFGKKYEVPDSLTIMEAMEYSGYQLVRGCGCRNGFCGACATIYRIAGDRELKACLACSTRVENNMYVATLPFFPLVKEVYDMEKLKPTQTVMMQLYPEIYACVGCNACTKACTQGLNVMQYIAYAQRGEYDCAGESNNETGQPPVRAQRLVTPLTDGEHDAQRHDEQRRRQHPLQHRHKLQQHPKILSSKNPTQRAQRFPFRPIPKSPTPLIPPLKCEDFPDPLHNRRGESIPLNARERFRYALPDRKLGRTALSVSSTHDRRRHRHWHEWRKRWTPMPSGSTASKHLPTMTRPSCYNDVRMIYSTL